MYIASKRVWLGGRFLAAVLKIDSGKIAEVLPYGEGENVLDYGEKRVVPGFIDVHTHGAYGFDVNSADPEGLRMWAKRLPPEGVTTFLPTLAADHKPVMLDALRNIAAVRRDQEPGEGAGILGAHMEGPYIDARYPGAQPLDAIVEPSVEEFDEYCAVDENLVRVMTIAPEHDADFALTRHANAEGVVITMGHTAATLEQVQMAAANGAKSVTHTYNAMTPFTHRANGVVGAALTNDDLYAEVICDCHHSTPEALSLLMQAKGPHRAVMITDSVMCKGFEPGTTFYFVNKEIVIEDDGCPHLVHGGNLAGSTLKMNDALRNLVERAGVPFTAAINACTANPAALLGESDRLGSLSAGHDADIVVLEDDYSVSATYCKGVLVGERE